MLNCCAIYPYLCAESEVLDNCHFHAFNFLVSLTFLSSTTELKLFTFDACQTKETLSTSIGGDHINLTAKLRPEEDRNGELT